MKRFVYLLNIVFIFISLNVFAADYDGDKKVDELSAHGGSVASTSKALIADPADTDTVTTATFQEIVTAVLGTSYDTAAKFASLLSAKQDVLSEGAFADGDKTKLDTVENNATADQTGAEVSYSDPDSNYTATNVDAAIAELFDVINGGVPNAATGKVDWSQLVNVPAGFADGTDADSGGATAFDDIGDPDAAGSISFDDGETVTFDGANIGETFFTISLNAADLTADTIGLLITAVDNDDPNYIPFLIQDDQDGTPDDLFKIDYQGNATFAGTVTANSFSATETADPYAIFDSTGTDLYIQTDAGANWEFSTSYTAGVSVLFSIDSDDGDVHLTGDLIGENAETFTNSTDGEWTSSGNLVIPDNGNIGSASDKDAIAIAANGEVTLSQELQANAGIDASGQTIIAANFTGEASAIADDVVTMDKIDDDGNFTSLTGDWATTGYVEGGVRTVETTTDTDVTVTGSNALFINNHASTIEYTLPADPETAGGDSKIFVFRNRQANAITITPATGDVIELDDADESAGEGIVSTGAVGEMAVLVGFDDDGTDRWVVTSTNGTWDGATD